VIMTVACPCCRYLTLANGAEWEICPVCFWEDDGRHECDESETGGPNGDVSLAAARANFARIGASDPRFLVNVRAPLPEEISSSRL
jgi:hypothetical protein